MKTTEYGENDTIILNSIKECDCRTKNGLYYEINCIVDQNEESKYLYEKGSDCLMNSIDYKVYTLTYDARESVMKATEDFDEAIDAFMKHEHKKVEIREIKTVLYYYCLSNDTFRFIIQHQISWKKTIKRIGEGTLKDIFYTLPLV